MGGNALRQVVQDQGAGAVRVVEVPPPVLMPFGALIALRASLISSGTERSKIEMGERSLLAKARARPDLARKVVEQARRDGLRSTMDLVRDRLSTPQPLGYSASGEIVQVGTSAGSLKPGMRVACAGAGYANHAELVYVPGNLCAAIPDEVSYESAAFATVAAIGLHGIRQAALTQGELVVVSGLGLVGQLVVRLLLAYGHPVVGVDPNQQARDEVRELAVAAYPPDAPELRALRADAVLLTAATSSSEPVVAAPQWCRDRARVVVVGDVGLELQRAPYYDAEVELRFSRSYGPGRYDPSYEEHSLDYPIGYVRWTEGRNLAEVLRLMASGRFNVDDLVTERFPLERAPAAYERLAHGGRSRALLLTYPHAQPTVAPIRLAATPQKPGRIRVGVCGAGNFARKVLLPALEQTQMVAWGGIATASGLTAKHVGEQRAFSFAATSAEDVISDDATDAVVVATRHDTHAALAARIAQAGKFGYIEKPLAITVAELDQLRTTSGAERLTTGFNRRCAPATVAMVNQLSGRIGPLHLVIRVNAGELPPSHWVNDPAQGGRLAGELCHFVDLACHLANAAPIRVSAAGPADRPVAQADNAHALLAFGDGSAASVSYVTSGGSALPKERVEAHWDGQSVVVDDFRAWEVFRGDKRIRQGSRRQDKGHGRLVAQFVDFARGVSPNPVPFHQAAISTRATLAVLEALASGQDQHLSHDPW